MVISGLLVVACVVALVAALITLGKDTGAIWDGEWSRFMASPQARIVYGGRHVDDATRATDRALATTANACWNWLGETTPNGYGRTSWRASRQVRSRAYAHRVAWELGTGTTVPKGLELDHLCRNRRCCNPAHLEPVTSRENTLRGEGVSARHAKKTHCPKGHSYSGDNVVIDNGGRKCRECRRVRGRIAYRTGQTGVIRD